MAVGTATAARTGQAEIIIPGGVGAEGIAGSTRMKAGTATKLVLNMITTTAMVKMNKNYGNVMVDLIVHNDKLWDRGSRIVADLAGLSHEEAFELLKRTDGEVKTALAMQLRGWGAQESRRRLQLADGSLRQVVESVG